MTPILVVYCLNSQAINYIPASIIAKFKGLKYVLF